MVTVSNDTKRETFLPDRITTLFVGESRPHGGTFFYDQNSKLFTAMKIVFGGSENFCDDFKSRGFYLDDLVPEPVNTMKPKERIAMRKASVASLAIRLKEYQPEAIVVVMCAIEPLIQKAKEQAGIKCDVYCTPFPAFGNQTRFREAMVDIIPNLPMITGNHSRTTSAQ